MSQHDEQGRPESMPLSQPQRYDQPYDQTYTQPYGQPQYGQPQYGQPQYGQYGPTAVPAKPASVVVAAVLGFIFGAFGVIATIALIFLGAAATGVGSSADTRFPGLGTLGGAVGGALIAIGLIALIWTVVLIWGSVWALTGRTRVMLLVAGSIALFFSAIGFLSSLSGSTSGGSVVSSLLFFLATLAIVVLLSLRSSGSFYAAHRALRSR
jgi:hypothetical protein